MKENKRTFFWYVIWRMTVLVFIFYNTEFLHQLTCLFQAYSVSVYFLWFLENLQFDSVVQKTIKRQTFFKMIMLQKLMPQVSQFLRKFLPIFTTPLIKDKLHTAVTALRISYLSWFCGKPYNSEDIRVLDLSILFRKL